MTGLWSDLRYALRQLRKSPGFAATAVLMVAIGIGANTAIFSLVHSILLRRLPFRNSERVFNLDQFSQAGLGETGEIRDAASTAATFRRNAKSFRSIEDAAMYSVQPANFSFADASPTRLSAAEVSAQYLRVLGVTPEIGRDFAPAEDTPDEDHVALISHRSWVNHFGQNPSVIGQTIHINTMTFTVIGVLPANMDFPSRADAWVPTIFDQHAFLREGGAFYASVLVRLNPDFTIAQAQSEFTARAQSILLEESRGRETLSASDRPVLTPIAEQLTVSIRPSLFMLSGAVFLVLLVACANLATLMLVRTGERRTELAVRAALGAPRGTLMRQKFVESILLAILGAGAGVLLAHGVLSALYHFRPLVLDQFPPPAIETNVLLFTMGLAVATGLLFGIAPAWMARNQDPGSVLKTGRWDLSASHTRLRRALVSGEIALAFILLVGAALLLRTIEKLNHVPLGFEIQNRLSFTVSLHGPSYKQDGNTSLFYTSALERLARLPGVAGVAAVSNLPLDRHPDMYLPVTGKNPDFLLYAAPRTVSAGYFATMGMPLLRGRDFSTLDSKGAYKSVIVTEGLAKKLWPGEDPLGQKLHSTFYGGLVATVIGVVPAVHAYGPREQTVLEYYLSYSQVNWPTATFVVRTNTDAATLLEPARRAMAEIDPSQPIFNAETMQERLQDKEALERFEGFTLSTFAAISIFLALAGLYGVISYSVVQRTREIGLRVALGAQKSDVLRTFILESAGLTLAGITISLAAIVGLTRFLRSVLYDISPTDSATIIFAAVLFLLAALLAAYIPARRATKIDPMVALRNE